MNPTVLDKHILATYFTLRIGIAIVAIALPVWLALGGYLWAGIELQDSISAYYHAKDKGEIRSMRNWFVGALFAIGAFLYLYKGYSRTENFTLNTAGILAILIAVIPMEWNCPGKCDLITPHGVVAVSFFLCIAFVVWRCSKDTLYLLPDENVRRSYKRRYTLLGAIMATAPISAALVSAFLQRFESYVFWIEVVGIYAFAAYWLFKSRELMRTEIERKVISGNMTSLQI